MMNATRPVLDKAATIAALATTSAVIGPAVDAWRGTKSWQNGIDGYIGNILDGTATWLERVGRSATELGGASSMLGQPLLDDAAALRAGTPALKHPPVAHAQFSDAIPASIRGSVDDALSGALLHADEALQRLTALA